MCLIDSVETSSDQRHLSQPTDSTIVRIKIVNLVVSWGIKLFIKQSLPIAICLDIQFRWLQTVANKDIHFIYLI